MIEPPCRIYEYLQELGIAICIPIYELLTGVTRTLCYLRGALISRSPFHTIATCGENRGDHVLDERKKQQATLCFLICTW